MARPHIERFVDRDVPLRRLTLPGFPKGLPCKMLSLDPDTGACSMTVRFAAGFRQPPGKSYAEMELFITAGEVRLHDAELLPGQHLVPPITRTKTTSSGRPGLDEPGPGQARDGLFLQPPQQRA